MQTNGAENSAVAAQAVRAVRSDRRVNRNTQRQFWRGLGLLTGLGAGLAGYAVLQEPLNICLERRTIRLPNAKGRLPTHGLRILHLSDTHFQGIDWREQTKIERIRQLTKGLDYDLLIHTGDFWHNEHGLENLLRLFDALPPPRLAGYGVFGNHDYVCYSHSDMFTRNWIRYQARKQQGTGLHQRGLATLMAHTLDLYHFAQFVLNVPFDLKRVHFNDVERLTQALASRGIEILHNRALQLRHKPGQRDGVDLHLAGVDDVTEGTPDLEQTLATFAPDEPNILLSHNPDVLEDPASRRANLILAGHTHGGQVVLRFIGAAHTHSEHLQRRQAAGYMVRDQTQVYVSRGIGEGIPLRFGARPQIALITVVGE
ncbi:MAG: metallophosphoesterase [Caldilineaceae bacterium]|nr:metallophosphoesterase [Caldilineaceae bacterium]